MDNGILTTANGKVDQLIESTDNFWKVTPGKVDSAIEASFNAVSRKAEEEVGKEFFVKRLQTELSNATDENNIVYFPEVSKSAYDMMVGNSIAIFGDDEDSMLDAQVKMNRYVYGAIMLKFASYVKENIAIRYMRQDPDAVVKIVEDAVSFLHSDITKEEFGEMQDNMRTDLDGSTNIYFDNVRADIMHTIRTVKNIANDDNRDVLLILYKEGEKQVTPERVEAFEQFVNYQIHQAFKRLAEDNVNDYYERVFEVDLMFVTYYTVEVEAMNEEDARDKAEESATTYPNSEQKRELIANLDIDLNMKSEVRLGEGEQRLERVS